MARTTKLSAVFGHPAQLVYARRTVKLAHSRLNPLPPATAEVFEWTDGARRHVEIKDKGGDGKAEAVLTERLDPQGNGFVRNRWVYLFAFDEDAQSTSLLLEMFAVSNIAMHINPNPVERRLDWEPEGTATTPPELPRKLALSRHWVAALATPFRLTDACIKALVKDNKVIELVPLHDLADRRLRSIDVTITDTGEEIPAIDHITLPVSAPFDVAWHLAADIERARSERMMLLGHKGSHNDHRPTPKQVEDRERYSFSAPLLQIAEHRDFSGDVDDDFAPGGMDKLRKFVKRYERQLTSVDLLADAIGSTLVAHMRRELMELLMNGCVVEDGDKLLRFLSNSMVGLSLSAPGNHYLGNLATSRDQNGFMHKMFASRGALEGHEFELAKRAGKHVVSGGLVVLAAEALFDRNTAQNLALAANDLMRDIDPRLAGALEERLTTLRTALPLLDARPGDDATKIVASRVRALVLKDDHRAAAAETFGSANFLIRAIDFLNFVSLVQQYFDTPAGQDDLRLKRGLTVVGSGGPVLAAFIRGGFAVAGRQVPQAAAFLIRGLGVIAGLHTALVSILESRALLDKGDYDAAIALQASATASVVGAGISSIALFEGLAGLGPIGFGLAVLGGVLFGLYLVVRDEPIETLVAHCHYGKEASQGSRRPPWSPVRLSELHSSWTHQALALAAIQRQFSVTFGTQANSLSQSVTPFFRVRVDVGYVDAETTFQFSWTWKAQLGAGTTEREWTSSKPESFDFGPLKKGPNGPALEVNIPAEAWKASGVDGPPSSAPISHAPFESLKVTVLKSFNGGESHIPQHRALTFEVQQGRSQPDTSRTISTMDKFFGE